MNENHGPLEQVPRDSITGLPNRVINNDAKRRNAAQGVYAGQPPAVPCFRLGGVHSEIGLSPGS